MPSAIWFVYMLECRGGRIYTGVTPDVAGRFARHCSGRGAAFTRINPPVKVLAAMPCGSRGLAQITEAALKKLPRPRKLVWAQQWATAPAAPPAARPRARGASGTSRSPR